jgi:hypothetical protein
VLLTKEEAVLQDTIERLTEFGRCYGMKMNLETTKRVKISEIIIDKKNNRKIMKISII